MDDQETVEHGVREWLHAARNELAQGRLHVAYEAGRHAAELSTKWLLLEEGATVPTKHDLGTLASEQGVVPAGVDPEALKRLLDDTDRGTYRFDEAVAQDEVERVVSVAERMADAVGTEAR